MSASIEYPASCEVHSVIRFLFAKIHKPVDNHRQLCEVYGAGIMSEVEMRQCRIILKYGRSGILYEDRSELSLEFPQISRSLLHEILVTIKGATFFCEFGAENLDIKLFKTTSDRKLPIALERSWMGCVWSPTIQLRSCAKCLSPLSNNEDLPLNTALRERHRTAGRR
ncbi:hypothetical protein AVEN_186887-1 [Araneus ventricosus]|uniref:Uncharacterized protein n=1 Tax=Araneus ventricosus TaxID=182803 RepID=A0A4Y2I4B5_ARAVE|nr:hypothetical protein AVEN_186887-1 [Araneus ventricosus]